MKHKTLLTLIVCSILVALLAACTTPQPTATATPTETVPPTATTTLLPTATNTLVPMPTKEPTATPIPGTLYCPDCEGGVIKLFDYNHKVVVEAHHGDAVEIMKMPYSTGKDTLYRVKHVKTGKLAYITRDTVRIPRLLSVRDAGASVSAADAPLFVPVSL